MASSVAGPPARLRRGRRARRAMTISNAGRPRRADRLQHRLVPPRSSINACIAARKQRGTEDRRDRPAPHRDAPMNATCTWRSTLAPTCCSSTACSRHLVRDRQRRSRPSSHKHHPRASRTTVGAGRRRCARRSNAWRRRLRPRMPADVRLFYRALRRDGADGHRSTARASTNRRTAPTRSTPSSTAIWRPAASASPAWDRSRSPASPMRWAGREVGGLANQLAAHMGFDDPADIDRVARFWQAPNIAAAAGLKAVDMFQARRRRPHQGALDHGHQSGGQHAGRRPKVRAALKALRFRRRLRRHPHRIRPATPMCCCRPPPGARRTARSPIRSGACRGSGRSCRMPGEAQAGLAHRLRRRRAGWALPRRSPSTIPAAIFREHAALSGFENDGRAAVRHWRARRHRSASLTRDFAPRRWPAASRTRRAERLFGDGALPDAGRARAVRAGPPGRNRRSPSTPPIPIALNTGRLRDQWHTMTRTGNVPRLMANAPEPAWSTFTLPTRRRTSSRTATWRIFRPRYGFAARQGPHHRCAATRPGLPADALERQFRRQCRRRNAVCVRSPILSPASRS